MPARLEDFVACYDPNNSDKSRAGRHERKESERFKSFTYEDLLKRDKLNLDFLRDDEPLLPMQRIFLQAGWLPRFASACRAFYEARALPWA